MCHAVRCRNCGLVTWQGCGRHVEEVMATVPPEARCQGHRDERRGQRFGWLRGR